MCAQNCIPAFTLININTHFINICGELVNICRLLDHVRKGNIENVDILIRHFVFLRISVGKAIGNFHTIKEKLNGVWWRQNLNTLTNNLVLNRNKMWSPETV